MLIDTSEKKMKKKILLFAGILIVTLALFAITKSTIFVESKLCVGCGDCVAVCPVDAIQIIDGKAIIDADACIDCEICIKSCTYDAIRKNK